MKKLLIMVMLLPSLLMAGDLTVKTQEVEVQPLNTIDRVSLRTKYTVIFERDSIGSGKREISFHTQPVHWDSAGVWKRFDFTERLTASALAAREDSKLAPAEYDKVINTGPHDVEYNSKTGKMRYAKKGVSVVYMPDSATATVETELIVNSRGMKTNLDIVVGSPMQLSWEITLAGVDAKTKLTDGGNLFSADGDYVATLMPFTVWDATGKEVPITTTYADGHVTALMDSAGLTLPFLFDPVVYDTSGAPGNGAALRWEDASFAKRNETSSENVYNAENSTVVWWGLSGGTYYIYRSTIPIDMSGTASAAEVDSAYFYMYLESNPPTAVFDTIRIIEGTYSGVAAINQWSQFTGRTASGAYTGTVDYTGTFATNSSSSEDTWYSAAFTDAGKTAIQAAMGNGVLPLFMINNEDIKNTTPGDLNWRSTWSRIAFPSYVKVYYTAGNPPGVTTAEQDTIRYVRVEIYGEVDSTGGGLDSVGIEYYPTADNSDTTSIAEVKTGVGEFSILTDSVVVGDSITVRAWARNSIAKSYGSWYMVLTTISGGAVLTVDGRTVNTAVTR